MIRNIKVWATLLLMGFVGGFFTSYFSCPQPLPITKEVIKWKTIERDYSNNDVNKQALLCYDTSAPILDINPIGLGFYRLNAGLCERTWTRDVNIDVSSSGNWRFYVGLSCGVVGTGALVYGVYKIIH